ncbi:MAG: septum formation protein Maf [Prevotellaceae bacterium]|nr:septum formation protein Maf [Prevotellaceae bacterium]
MAERLRNEKYRLAEGYKIILASNSPRRKELLGGLGIDFEVRTLQGIDESYPSTLKGEDIPMHISAKKAEEYRATMADNEMIITADTIVYDNGEVLGKPKDREDAVRMLRQLSGHAHEVITGVSILTKSHAVQFASTSKVYFAALTDEEIYHYVDTFRPFDKAGAYGIQEWIGFVAVTRIEGSYFNVMGLPIQRLYTELKAFPPLP